MLDAAEEAAGRILRSDDAGGSCPRPRLSTERGAPDWQARSFSSRAGSESFHSIRRPRSASSIYQAISAGRRGANLDTIDLPLVACRRMPGSSSDEIRALHGEARLQAIGAAPPDDHTPTALRRRRPGAAAAPLVKGPGFDEDPAFLECGAREHNQLDGPSRGSSPCRVAQDGRSRCATGSARRPVATVAGRVRRRRLSVAEIRLAAGGRRQGWRSPLFLIQFQPFPVRPVESTSARGAAKGDLAPTWRRAPGPRRQRGGVPMTEARQYGAEGIAVVLARAKPLFRAGAGVHSTIVRQPGQPARTPNNPRLREAQEQVAERRLGSRDRKRSPFRPPSVAGRAGSQDLAALPKKGG